MDSAMVLIALQQLGSWFESRFGPSRTFLPGFSLGTPASSHRDMQIGVKLIADSKSSLYVGHAIGWPPVQVPRLLPNVRLAPDPKRIKRYR